MIDQEYGRMQPLYEAMSVGSYTIAWLEQKEQERSDFEFQFNLARLCKSVEDFIQVCSSGNPLRETPHDGVQRLTYCADTLAQMVQIVIRRGRERLPETCEGLRQTIAGLLNQIEELEGRMEDILEAWQISLDPKLSAQIDVALGEIDKTKTEIPNWRETLELVSH